MDHIDRNLASRCMVVDFFLDVWNSTAWYVVWFEHPSDESILPH